jgi:hypothetical protein
MNYVKPGCHRIIIYDPKTKDFYRKVIMIEYKNSDPNPKIYNNFEEKASPWNKKKR